MVTVLLASRTVPPLVISAQLRFSASNLLHRQASEFHDYRDADGRRYRVTQTPTHATLRILLEHQL